MSGAPQIPDEDYEAILELIAEGMTLSAACRTHGRPGVANLVVDDLKIDLWALLSTPVASPFMKAKTPSSRQRSATLVSLFRSSTSSMKCLRLRPRRSID